MSLLQKYGLRFSDEIERQFSDYYFDKSINITRIALLLAIGLYVLYAALDTIMLPKSMTIAWIIRFAIQIPIMAVTLVFSYRKIFRNCWQPIVAFNALISGFGIIAMIMLSETGEPGYDHYFSGLILVVMWAFTFSRLTFLYTTSICFSFVAGYALLQIVVNQRFSLGFTSEPASVFINSMVCLSSVYILGQCAAFSIEYYIRNNFRQQLIILEKQSDKISHIDTKVNTIMENLVSSSENINSSAQTVSNDANNLATTFEEITATMEEIFGGIESTAGNSEMQYNAMNNLLGRMEKFTENITNTQVEVQKMHDKSKNILDIATVGDTNINLMSRSMSTIQGSSKEMTNIVEIIKKISDEINLLSLNASIEAARAGEAGRGFAVVAEAISKLADDTSKSLGGIDKLILANQKEITSGIQTAEETVKSQAMIIEGVSDNFNTMLSILEYMNRQLEENKLIYWEADDVRAKSQEIKLSTEEQKLATVEILNSITSLNPLSANNASLSSNLASTSHDLNDNVVELKQMLLKLTAEDENNLA